MAFQYQAPRKVSVRATSTALVLVDQRPLQREAWAEFRRAQRLQEKAARDLHRHENTDTPAFVRWLHSTFSAMVSEARELNLKVESLAVQVQQVQRMALMTGRSPRELWREYKEYLADPEAFERKVAEAEASERAAMHGEGESIAEDDDEDSADGLKDFLEGVFGKTDRAAHEQEGSEEFWEAGGGEGGFDFFNLFGRRKPEAVDAREIYRRLVQQLHPDRGGEWTPLRERVWHEVQKAWAVRDTDWLARLEIEWETAHDVINEHSSLGRLRRAIDELHAARRDVQRKLREYRKSSSWRFTLTEKKRVALRQRTEAGLRHEIEVLRRELSELEYTIAEWELPLRPRRSSSGRRQGRRRA